MLKNTYTKDESNVYQINEQDYTFAELMDSLVKNYRNVFLVDKISHEIQIYRYQNTEVGVSELIDAKQPYDIVVNAYIDNNVFELDREKMRQAMKLELVCQQLERVQQFTVHYRIKRQGEISFYYMKCARIGDAWDFQKIVMAFCDENEDAKRVEVANVIEKMNAGPKRKILIVEDNALTREILVSILEDEYEILMAGDGEEGLHVLEKNYDDLALILLDVQMPKCNGFQFMERVKDDVLMSSVPIIVTTTSDQANTELECLNMGARDFIVKPYNAKLIKSRIKNIIELKKASRTLKALEIDTLTGVYTRQAFIHYLSMILEQKRDENIHLVVAKITDLKLVNSVYGSKIADDILTYLAKTYKAYAHNGIVARLGSSSFACAMVGEQNPEPEEIAQKVAEIEKDMPISNVKVKYGIYINIDKSLPVEVLCDCGIAAIESLGDAYEQRMAYYTDEIVQKKIQNRQIENDFEDAIKNREFQIYYQPKHELENKAITGAEALVRWVKADGACISPGEFIPVYEMDGLIVKLDEYVFRSVCTFQKKCMDAGRQLLPISINLSRASINHEHVAARYIQIIKDYDIPFEVVPIELTESATVGLDHIQDEISQLVQAGFRLHVDDFGSGYSSLNILNQLPFSVLKIDKSLIDNITQVKGKLVVKQVITLAQMLDMEIVAEGVEYAGQLDILKDMKVDAIQGFYFARPMPEREFVSYCERYGLQI